MSVCAWGGGERRGERCGERQRGEGERERENVKKCNFSDQIFLPVGVCTCVLSHSVMRTSVVAACRFSSCGFPALEHRLNGCGTQASLLCGMWDLPGLGIEPVSPAMTASSFTADPSGKL